MTAANKRDPRGVLTGRSLAEIAWHSLAFAAHEQGENQAHVRGMTSQEMGFYAKDFTFVQLDHTTHVRVQLALHELGIDYTRKRYEGRAQLVMDAPRLSRDEAETAQDALTALDIP
jgi:hypothetical protein